jgi:hypothetical protein
MASVQLTLSREGLWFHEGGEITHPGLVHVLNRGLVVLEDGAVEVRVGHERAQVTVEERPYFVTEVGLGDPLTVRLNDESQERVPLAALRIRGEDALLLPVKGGRFMARFLRGPYLKLASLLEAEGQGYVLPLRGGRRAPIPRDEA